MAELSFSGRMSVKTLKNQFKKEFGVTLRVYNGARFADDDATLASLRKGDDKSKGGDFKASGNMFAGTFEKKFKETYGIKVQVANADDSKLIGDTVTLAAASKA
jgi:methylphosphotriester-DNA--protein-cysteine methyltransferase